MNAPVAIKSVGVRSLPSFRVPERDEKRETVPVRYLENPVAVIVTRGPDFVAGDELKLTLDGNDIGTPFTIPNVTDDEYTLYIQVADLPPNGSDTKVILNYIYRDTFSGLEEPSPHKISVRFDRQPPGGRSLPPIAFTDEQRDGITDTDIKNGVLPLSIDPYSLIATEDTLDIWIGTDPNDESSGVWFPKLGEVDDPAETTVANLPRAALVAQGDGRRYFAYRATDWAGNVSVWSWRTGINVGLQSPSLAAPVVPANADGLIVYPEANPVVVEIPPYPGVGIPAVGDQLILSWGSQPLPPYSLLPGDIGNDPLATIKVPLDVVRRVGDGSVVVRYQMRRVGFDPASSPDVTVQVDLRTPGGVDPTPDDPIHGNLIVPALHCGSSPVNTIEPDDFGADARVVVPRLGVDGTVIWAVNDVVQLHYQSLSSPELPAVTVTAGNAGADIEIPVPYATVIDPTGTGTIKVWFTVTRMLPATPNPVPVTVPSPVQEVQVASRDALPGGTAGLQMGVFPDANGDNVIIPRKVGTELVRNTVFRIPLAGVSNIEISDNPRLSYEFIGHRTVGRPARPVPTAPPAPLPDKIAESKKASDKDIDLTAADLARGYYEVELPYVNLTDWICTGGATLNYTLINDAGRAVAPARWTYFAVNPPGQACRV
ncbi:TPA: hypothetical protein ACKP22_004466 [Pseudomonas putida]